MIKHPFPWAINIKMMLIYRPQIKYIPRAIFFNILIFLQQAFHLIEFALLSKKIELHHVEKSPIVIIGYWRSGTTYLQRLLCINPKLAYLTQYQAFFPLGSTLHSKIFKPIVNAFIKLFNIKHPSHDVLLDMDFPSEDDIALCCASYPHTPMWSHIYPNHKDHFFNEPLISNINSDQSRWFMDMYKYFVQKLSYLNGNKQLILKSPSNTTKIPEILRAFPSTKFIYIHRTPKQVFFSNMKLLTNNKHHWLQAMNKKEMIAMFLSSYRRILDRYQRTKNLIPTENLIELDFDELCLHPKRTINSIYKNFNLPRFVSQEFIYENFLKRHHLKQKNYYSGDLPRQVSNMFKEILMSTNGAELSHIKEKSL